MKSTRIRLKISRKQLAWLKFIFESYEGLALVTVLDGTSGSVLISVSPGSEKDVAELLSALKIEINPPDQRDDDYSNPTKTTPEMEKATC